MSQIRGKSIKSSVAVVYKHRNGNLVPLGTGWSKVHLYSDCRDGSFRLYVWNCDKLLMNVEVRKSCHYWQSKPNLHTFKNHMGRYGFGFNESEESLSFAKTMKSLIKLLKESAFSKEFDEPGFVQAKLEEMGLINPKDFDLNDDHGKVKHASVVDIKEGPQFGVTPGSLPCTVSKGQKIPNILLDLKEVIIKKNGLSTCNIFSINPEKTVRDVAKEKINRGASVSGTVGDVHTAASLLKSWFSELPKPILDIIGREKVNASQTVDKVVKAHHSLRWTERSSIIWLWDFLVDVAEHSEINKMVIPKLAQAFAPCLYHDHGQDFGLMLTYNGSVRRFCTKAMGWRKEERKKTAEKERKAQELRKMPLSPKITEDSDRKQNQNDTINNYILKSDAIRLSKGRFETWTTEDVAKWTETLDSGKLKTYSQCFRENEVDGSLLTEFSENEMNTFFKEELEIRKAGDRAKLLRAVLKETRDLETRLAKDMGLPDDEVKLESQLSLNNFQESGLFKSARMEQLRLAANNDDPRGKALLDGLLLLNSLQSKIKSLEKPMIKNDAFLSHVQANSSDLCRLLHADLFKWEQITTWYDMSSKRLDIWGIVEGVATAKVFVAVVTQNYFVRKWPVFEFLLAELFQKHIILLMETVKGSGGFDTFDEFRASIPDYFKKWLDFEACKVERRGTFWRATITELAIQIKRDVHQKIILARVV